MHLIKELRAIFEMAESFESVIAPSVVFGGELPTPYEFVLVQTNSRTNRGYFDGNNWSIETYHKTGRMYFESVTETIINWKPINF